VEFGGSASYIVRRLLNDMDEVEQLQPTMGANGIFKPYIKKT